MCHHFVLLNAVFDASDDENDFRAIKRLSIDTMDAAQEEMNMLGFIFQRTKTMDKQKV